MSDIIIEVNSGDVISVVQDNSRIIEVQSSSDGVYQVQGHNVC
mgnify:CR=1 FL=1